MATRIRTHVVFGPLIGIHAPSGEVSTLWQPRLDVYETLEELLIQIEAPGLALDNLELQFEPGRLTVAGVRTRPPLSSGARAALVEMQYGPFRRTINLPDDAEGDGINATYEAGILLVKVPRRARTHIQPIKIGINE